MHVTITLVGSAVATMLVLGTVSLVASIGYNSSILAFIGLGLVFWGAVLLYVKPEEYTRETLLEAALSPPLRALNQMILIMGYKGDATYLPPKYFTDPEATRICVSKYKYASLPTPEQIQPYEDQPLTRTAHGLLLTPPGFELSKLLEKSLGKSFIKTDLESLLQNLPKIFIEDLEIAQNLELQKENGTSNTKKDNTVSLTPVKNTTVHARITKPIIRNTIKEAEGSQITSSILFPLCSAIAIAVTKATGKPVRITDTKSSEDGNVLEANFEIVEE
ncbi:MAG: hypothetical protein ABSD73_11410 [Candidatus Bathyarchaeia archaeon]